MKGLVFKSRYEKDKLGIRDYFIRVNHERFC